MRYIWLFKSTIAFLQIFCIQTADYKSPSSLWQNNKVRCVMSCRSEGCLLLSCSIFSGLPAGGDAFLLSDDSRHFLQISSLETQLQLKRDPVPSLET